MYLLTVGMAMWFGSIIHEDVTVWALINFCTCTTQRSSVWWWMPDEYVAWACLHGGQRERKRGRGWSKVVKLQQRSNCKINNIYMPFFMTEEDGEWKGRYIWHATVLKFKILLCSQEGEMAEDSLICHF